MNKQLVLSEKRVLQYIATARQLPSFSGMVEHQFILFRLTDQDLVEFAFLDPNQHNEYIWSLGKTVKRREAEKSLEPSITAHCVVHYTQP